MKVKNIIKTCFIVLLIIYGFVGGISLNQLKIDASLMLLFAVIFTIKAHKNTIVFPVGIFLLYCIYSIAVGEFLTEGLLGVPMTEVKNLEIYGKTLRILLVFIGSLSICYSKNNYKEINIKSENNSIIFYGLCLILIIIGIFGVDRTVSNSYKVSITPIYEYSIILFYYAYYYSGKLKMQNILLFILYAFFILQDFYYGGRITALQLVFMMIFTLLSDKLNTKKILYSSLIGIFVNSLVGAYRSSYSMSGIDVENIFINLINNFFVFDTATYSFYASATHLATIPLVSNKLRFTSFLEFIKAVLIGSDSPIANLTVFLSNNYFQNIGGGIFPSHIYFWLGWPGVILLAVLIAHLLNSAQEPNKEKLRKYFLIILATMPRWFLYSPLNLFRPLLFVFIIGRLLIVFDKMIRKTIYIS